ncbi:RNA polymerase subunit sigma-70 [Streptodolium elevatio]|uniref:RNA polymerase subunit sigma-70 n=1 Tax=Streptodolium elevatio TaxID=3157996 RepID=A0ABV3DSP3_9ACTN
MREAGSATSGAAADATAAVREAFAILAAVPDPYERALAVGVVLEQMPDLQTELRGIRQEAVVQMRETRTIQDIAAALGLSQPRVSQIAKGVSRTVKRTGSAAKEDA